MNSSDLIKQLSSDLTPVKPLASVKQRFINLSLITVAIMSLGIIYWYFKKEEFHIPMGRSFFEGLALILAAAFNGYLAVKSVSPHTATVKAKKYPVLFFVLWTLTLVVAFVALYLKTGSEALIAMQYNTTLCPIVIISIMLPVGIASWLYLKRGALLFPRTTFFYWAQLMVVIGALGLSFICPWTDPLHELLWHVLPSFLFIATGYFAAIATYKLFVNKNKI